MNLAKLVSEYINTHYRTDRANLAKEIFCDSASFEQCVSEGILKGVNITLMPGDPTVILNTSQSIVLAMAGGQVYSAFVSPDASDYITSLYRL